MPVEVTVEPPKEDVARAAMEDEFRMKLEAAKKSLLRLDQLQYVRI